MRLILTMIPNTEKLIEIINETCGNVILHLPDKKSYDLKKDSTAQDLLKQEIYKGNKIEIYISDGRDYFKFIYFMIGANV